MCPPLSALSNSPRSLSQLPLPCLVTRHGKPPQRNKNRKTHLGALALGALAREGLARALLSGGFGLDRLRFQRLSGLVSLARFGVDLCGKESE